MTRRITLVGPAALPVGEVGTDLLRAELHEESDPSHLVLKGDSPLIRELMECRRKHLVMVVELCANCGVEQRFRVVASTLKYENGAWTNHVDLVRIPTP